MASTYQKPLGYVSQNDMSDLHACAGVIHPVNDHPPFCSPVYADPISTEMKEVGEIDEGEEGFFVEFYPDNSFHVGQKVYFKVGVHSGTHSHSRAVQDVIAERQRQDTKWGGPEHDDKQSPSDFVQLVQDYAGRAQVMDRMSSADKYRRRMVQVAALAIAAVEAADRAAGRD